MTDDRARSDEALRAWFLGPRAENGDALERLIVESLRDHVFWRRNHHPEDGVTIQAADRRTAGYDDAMTRLSSELFGLLAMLKRDVPFFSGRYQAHMVGEQTIASQVAYLATMLYNPNNVVAEVSPVTTRLELEAAAQLAEMIGYDPVQGWGHLTSGGTVANFEALWIARGVRYLPVALALAARDLDVDLSVELPRGGTGSLRGLSLWELLNLQPREVLDCWHRIHESGDPDRVRRAIDAHSLAAIGYQDYTRRLATAFGDPLPAGIVLVSSTGHYSWEKIVRALGIGSRRMLPVAVDAHARLDTDALWRVLQQCAAERTPVIALVSVCGTTEEGAVDRLDEVVRMRERAARELGLTFHLHADACHGGYAAALTRDADGSRLDGPAIRTGLQSAWPSDEWVASIVALADADSVTIDPHKLGYVPYPAGAFLLRDGRARSLVSQEPPYLAPTAGGEDGFLGRWILEGSKPGAAAAAVWLSHRVVRLDRHGYGHLVARTHEGAARLHQRLAGGGIAPFMAVCLPSPDLNVVNWVVRPAEPQDLHTINDLNTAIHARLSPARAEPEYYLSRTRLSSPDHDGIVLPLLERLGVGDCEWRREGLVMLRAVIMDPFFGEGPPTPDHLGGFLDAVRGAAHAHTADVSGS